MRHIRKGKSVIAASAVMALPSRPLPCAGLAVLLLSGCAVGPDFEKPAAPEVSDYTVHPLPATAASPNSAGGEAQRFTKWSDIAADWWTLFHSKPLSDLIEQSLANNSDLKAARAALSVARENTLAQRGAYYPALNAGFTATRSRGHRRRFRPPRPIILRNTISSRRSSASPMCPMFSVLTAAPWSR